MRWLSIAVVLLAGLPAIFAEDITTISGKVYRDVKVSRVMPDGLELTSTSGIVKVRATDLAAEYWRKYGFRADQVVAFEQEKAKTQDAAAQQRQQQVIQKAIDDVYRDRAVPATGTVVAEYRGGCYVVSLVLKYTRVDRVPQRKKVKERFGKNGVEPVYETTYETRTTVTEHKEMGIVAGLPPMSFS